MNDEPMMAAPLGTLVAWNTGTTVAAGAAATVLSVLCGADDALVDAGAASLLAAVCWLALGRALACCRVCGKVGIRTGSGRAPTGTM